MKTVVVVNVWYLIYNDAINAIIIKVTSLVRARVEIYLPKLIRLYFITYHQLVRHFLLEKALYVFKSYGYGVSHHFQQYFSYIVEVSFIGGGNRSTRIKPPTYRKSPTNFITKCCIEYTSPERGSNSQL